MVSITHVAATRTVIATDGVPVQGNVEQVALQLLATMADDAAAWSAPLLPTQPLSPPSPHHTSKQEDEVNSLPPVSKIPPTRPNQKMKIIPLIPALADQTDDPTCSPAYRPPPLSPLISATWPYRSPSILVYIRDVSQSIHSSESHGCCSPSLFPIIWGIWWPANIRIPSRQILLYTCRCHCICGACCPCQCICEGRGVSYKRSRFCLIPKYCPPGCH